MVSLSPDKLSSTPSWLQPSISRIYGALLVFFVLLGGWLVVDLQKGYEKVLAETSQHAIQQSRITSESFRNQVLAADYVLRDVLGRIQEKDLAYPAPGPDHALRMTTLLAEKGKTVPGYFSMVLFNRDCVFTATDTGRNTGIRSAPSLCEARKMHRGPGPQTLYIPGARAASGQSVIVLSRNLMSPADEFQGGVLGVFELRVAQRWLESYALDDDASVALLDESGVLLAGRPFLQDAIGKPWIVPRMPAALREANGKSIAVTHVDLDGRERIVGISALEGFPLAIAYGFDKARAIEEWQRRLVELAAGFVALLLLVLLVARAQWTTIRQQAELRSSEAHFRMLAENMVDAVWKVDAQLRFTYINAADERMRGFSREEVIGTSLIEHFDLDARERLHEKFQKHRDGEASGGKGVELTIELPMLCKDGGEVWVEIVSVPTYGSDGKISGYQGIGRDISKRKRRQDEMLDSHQRLERQLRQADKEKSTLLELSTRDPLTGLYNRRHLDDTLPRELERAGAEGSSLAVIMMDLDHFKRVNDRYSHAAGDEVLKALAGLLKKGVRDSDMICRYGGEEFVAIMPGMSAELALQRVDAWRRQLEGMSVVYGESTITTTLSAGIAVFPIHGRDMDELLMHADEMLYKSKSEGRNRVTVYDASQAGELLH